MTHHCRVDRGGARWQSLLQAQLKIIDTAGTEQFTSMVELYIQNCQGFVLVYDVTKKTSFEGLEAIKSMIWKVKVRNEPPPIPTPRVPRPM